MLTANMVQLHKFIIVFIHFCTNMCLISLDLLALLLAVSEQKYQNKVSISILLHHFVRAVWLILLFSFVVVVVVVGRGNDLMMECPKAMSDRPELHRNETVFLLTAITQCALQ